VISLEHLLLVLVVSPGVSFLLLAFGWLVGAPLRERAVARLTSLVFVVMTVAALWLAGGMYSAGAPAVTRNLGPWFKAGEYAFQLDLVADRLSLPLMALTSILVGIVGAFSRRYMHREKGFYRFFLLLHLFAFGSLLIFAAGSFDLLIGGWELVGITSALLAAFFHQRRDPVRSSLHVFSVYRIGDLGLLLGVFVLHYLGGTAEDSHLFAGSWPMQSTNLTSTAATLTGLLFLFAAAAKSAQVPFFGWLPRAMEGPTPSSAIFYGAISIHAGAYLLLRIEPILTAAPIASAAVVAIGFISALVGTAAHRVVADAKTSIAYAAMTQVGIIFVEIGVGFPRLALAHMIGHAIVRTLQFLRAPSLLHDYHRVHAAAGGHLGATGKHYRWLLPEGLRLWAYRFALDRAFYDALINRAAAGPVLSLSHWLGTLEPGATPSPAADVFAGPVEVATLEKTNA
jgi:NADH:ubiquinone oxidoreductase subunit 5 (subunit L)/multisubunit Na+/H+ antiporter MnhA subunit